jgi:hypothetical protein
MNGVGDEKMPRGENYSLKFAEKYSRDRAFVWVFGGH